MFVGSNFGIAKVRVTLTAGDVSWATTVHAQASEFQGQVTPFGPQVIHAAFDALANEEFAGTTVGAMYGKYAFGIQQELLDFQQTEV